jgi:hypothetical protein
VTDPDAVIADKLDTLIRLVAFVLIDDKKQTEQIRVLALAGIKPTKIADILVTTSNTVNVALSALRREGQIPSGGKKRNAKR